MPNAIKNFHEEEASTDAAPAPHWAMFDLVLLGALTTGAILAIAAFAYIVVIFVH